AERVEQQLRVCPDGFELERPLRMELQEAEDSHVRAKDEQSEWNREPHAHRDRLVRRTTPSGPLQRRPQPQGGQCEGPELERTAEAEESRPGQFPPTGGENQRAYRERRWDDVEPPEQHRIQYRRRDEVRRDGADLPADAVRPQAR